MRSAGFLGLILTFASLACWAKPNDAYTIVQLENNRIRLTFTDGREAETFVSMTSRLKVPFPMTMSENSCNFDQVKPQCNLVMHGESGAIKLLWTKHSNTAKIKTPVMLNLSGSKDEFIQENFSISMNDEQVIGKKTRNHFGAFACDDYGWLTGTAGKKIPKKNIFFSWGSEINTMNTETSANDNLTFGGALNVKMTSALGVYLIESNQFYALTNPDLPLVTTGPTNLTYKNSDGEICQAVFSQDISRALKIITAAQSASKDTFTTAAIPLRNRSMILEQLNGFLSLVTQDSGGLE